MPPLPLNQYEVDCPVISDPPTLQEFAAVETYLDKIKNTPRFQVKDLGHDDLVGGLLEYKWNLHQLADLRDLVRTGMEEVKESLTDTLRTELAEVKKEMGREVGEVKKELGEVKRDLGRELGDVKQDLGRELGDVKQDLGRELGDVKQDLGRELGDVKQDLGRELGDVKRDLGGELGEVKETLKQVSLQLWRAEVRDIQMYNRSCDDGNIMNYQAVPKLAGEGLVYPPVVGYVRLTSAVKLRNLTPEQLQKWVDFYDTTKSMQGKNETQKRGYLRLQIGCTCP